MVEFRNQLSEDIKLLQENFSAIDKNLDKDEYAFNLWVMTKLYDIDEEIALENIIEYNDRSIDCFVHYEESKDLFIIQNKYYDEKTSLSDKDIAYFLETPLHHLLENKYKRSKELQDIFNAAIEDPEYKIYFHFYKTNNLNENLKSHFDTFNQKNHSSKIQCSMMSKYFNLDDIYELYYGESFKEDQFFEYVIKSINKGTVLRILPKDYSLEGMSKAFYIMTPVFDIYDMYKQSKKKEYPLFEENIREYLGNSSINGGIIKTLNDKEERTNFFYYNNGITIICTKAEDQGAPYRLTLTKPQIVNGCQTVNSIYEVLSSYKDEEIEKEFKNTYVMIKVLVTDHEDKTFYTSVVKFTNSQNSINEKAFGSVTSYFLNLQKSFQQRGFLLLVKPSDKNKFKNSFEKKTEISKFLNKGKDFINDLNLPLEKISDAFIPLDKLLQVYLAYVNDGFFAFTKKNLVLNGGGRFKCPESGLFVFLDR